MTGIKIIAEIQLSKILHPLPKISRGRFGRALVLAVLTLLIAPDLSTAKAVVRGHADAVVLDLDDSLVEDALKALGASFSVRYDSSASLQKRLSGRYHGSLRQVVRRMLEGYDFVATNRDGGLDVRVLGRDSPPLAAKAADPTRTATQPAYQVIPRPRSAEHPAITSEDRQLAPDDEAPRVKLSVQVAELKPTPTEAPLPTPELRMAEGQTPPTPVPTTGSEEKRGPVPTQNGGSGPVPVTQGSDPMSGPTPVPSSSTANRPSALPNPSSTPSPAAPAK